MNLQTFSVPSPGSLLIDKGLVRLDVIEQCGEEHSATSREEMMSEILLPMPDRSDVRLQLLQLRVRRRGATITAAFAETSTCVSDSRVIEIG